MKNALKKLKNNDGVSFLAALLFLMLCITLTLVIVSAAVGNVGRSSDDEDNRRAQLSVASAVQMFSDGITSMEYGYSTAKGTVPSGCGYVKGHSDKISDLRRLYDSVFDRPSTDYSTTVTISGNSQLTDAVKAQIKTAADNILGQITSAAGYTNAYKSTFTVSGDGMSTVTVTLTMDKDFNLRFSFYAEGGGTTMLTYRAAMTHLDIVRTATHTYGDPETVCTVEITETKYVVAWICPPEVGEN